MKRETDQVPLGLLIREAREQVGYSQRKLAALVGVSPSYLSRLERCRRSINPQVTTLLKFLRVLGPALVARLANTWSTELNVLKRP